MSFYEPHILLGPPNVDSKRNVASNSTNNILLRPDSNNLWGYGSKRRYRQCGGSYKWNFYKLSFCRMSLWASQQFSGKRPKSEETKPHIHCFCLGDRASFVVWTDNLRGMLCSNTFICPSFLSFCPQSLSSALQRQTLPKNWMVRQRLR